MKEKEENYQDTFLTLAFLYACVGWLFASLLLENLILSLVFTSIFWGLSYICILLASSEALREYTNVFMNEPQYCEKPEVTFDALHVDAESRWNYGCH